MDASLTLFLTFSLFIILILCFFKFNIRSYDDGLYFIKKFNNKYMLEQLQLDTPLGLFNNIIKLNYSDKFKLTENKLDLNIMADDKTIECVNDKLKVKFGETLEDVNNYLDVKLNKGIVNKNGLTVDINNNTLCYDDHDKLKVKFGETLEDVNNYLDVKLNKGIVNKNGLTVDINNNTLYYDDDDKLSSFFPNHEFYSNFKTYNFKYKEPINIFEGRSFILRPNGVLQITVNIRISDIEIDMSELSELTAVEFVSLFSINSTAYGDYFVADNIVYTQKKIVNLPYIIKVNRMYKNTTDKPQNIELLFTVVFAQPTITYLFKSSGMNGNEYAIPSVTADFYYTE